MSIEVVITPAGARESQAELTFENVATTEDGEPLPSSHLRNFRITQAINSIGRSFSNTGRIISADIRSTLGVVRELTLPKDPTDQIAVFALSLPFIISGVAVAQPYVDQLKEEGFKIMPESTIYLLELLAEYSLLMSQNNPLSESLGSFSRLFF